MALGRVSDASLISSATGRQLHAFHIGKIILTHMDGTVISQHRCNSGGEPNESRRSGIIPATAIVEASEHSIDIVARCQYPKWNNDREEADDMDDQNQTFDKWQVLGQEGIEQDGE